MVTQNSSEINRVLVQRGFARASVCAARRAYPPHKAGCARPKGFLIREVAKEGIRRKQVSWLKQLPTERSAWGEREKTCCAGTSLEIKWMGAADA